MLCNRCTGIYKFGNNTYARHIRQDEFRLHFSGKKVRLMDRKIRYILCRMRLMTFPLIPATVIISNDSIINKTFKNNVWPSVTAWQTYLSFYRKLLHTFFHLQGGGSFLYPFNPKQQTCECQLTLFICLTKNIDQRNLFHCLTRFVM